MAKIKCSCDYCDTRAWKDFQGYQIGDEEPVPYKKRGGYTNRCRRSKDGQHDWTGKRYQWTYRQIRNEEIHKYEWKRVYAEVKCCSKCSKIYSRWGY